MAAIKLTKDIELLTSKPQTSAKDRIHKLKRGSAYEAGELATEWGISKGTVKRHAKEIGCFFFLRSKDGEWVEVVVHPDTAKEYTK